MAEKKTSSTKSGNESRKASGNKNSSDNSKTAANSQKEKSISEVIGLLAEKTGLTKTKAKEFLDAHAALLVDELKQTGSVQLAGIGKLKLGERGERQGRNPATGEAITIKASKTIKFAGGKAFKDNFK